MEYGYPGSFIKYPLVHEKYPNPEFDPNGVPYGIQPDPERPYLDAAGRRRWTYVYRPASIKPMMNAHAMIVVTDSGSEYTVERELVEGGFLALAERESFFLFFPLSVGSWSPDDVDYLRQLIHAVSISCVFPGRERCHDYRICLVASGRGADIAHIVAARFPDRLNSILSFGGEISGELMGPPDSEAAMSVWMADPRGDGLAFWCAVNGLDEKSALQLGDARLYKDPENSARQVCLIHSPHPGFDGGILFRFWDQVFKTNIRPFSTGRGRVESISDALEGGRASVHYMGRSLSCGSHAPHTWLEYCPGNIEPGRRYPLVLFLHGGACDAFIEAANTGLHRLGEKQGFFTVYPTASNGYSWNSVLHSHRDDDVEYLRSLIEHMLSSYPIDPSRVYMSGFSNGSGMAQVFSAIHPELVAGVLAFNTRYAFDSKAWAAAAGPKSRYNYRMPVFYSYGTRDVEFPLKNGSSQFSQMDFWKNYNNIANPKPDENYPGGFGAPADRVVSWGRCGRHGKPIFTTAEFNTCDPSGINLYNYTFVESLPHAVEPRLFPAGLAYLFQFSRQADGSLSYERTFGDYELYEV